MRTARRVGPIAVLLIALIAGGAARCGSTSDERKSGACAVPTAPSGGAAGQAASAPGGGGLRVAEKGFSQVGASGTTVSLGAELENTSTQVAYRARVTFAYADAHGRSAAPPDSAGLRLEIPMILPGQRIPVGTWSYVTKAANGTSVRVADARVSLGAVTWVAPDSAAFAKIKTSPRGISRSDVNTASGTVSYTVDSPYCGALTSRGVGMVFRNSSGAIIGGSIDLTGTRRACTPGGSAGQALVTQSLPTGLADDKTEIYPYCDLAPATSSTGDAAPVN